MNCCDQYFSGPCPTCGQEHLCSNYNIDFRLPIEEYVELFNEPRTYKGCLLEAEKIRNQGLEQSAATIEKLVIQIISAEARILRLLKIKK